VAILVDILLGYTVPIFTKKAKRKLSAHPKFYLFDTGVFRSLRPRGPLDRPEEIDGQALEGLVAQHLRAWIAYSRLNGKCFFANEIRRGGGFRDLRPRRPMGNGGQEYG